MAQERIKILAIDDILDNLLILQAIIGETFENAIFFTALSGTKGIELAKSIDPDVILLDIVMPVMDGYQVCEILKKDDKLKEIPVVFVTANRDDKGSRIHALDVGAEAFLSKPIDESELIAQIRAMHKVRKANLQKKNESKRLEALVADKTMELNATIAVLKQEKDLAQNYLNIAGVIIVILDSNENVSLMNKKGCSIIGIDEKDIIGKNWFDNYIPEGSRNEMRNVFSKSFTNETYLIDKHENIILTTSGEERLISWNNSFLYNNEGNVIGVLSSGEDVTERQIAVNELKYEKELAQKYLNDLILTGNIFENSITNAPAPIIIHAEDGTVLNVSQTITKLTHYTKSDIPTIFEWTKKAYGKDKGEVLDFISKLYALPETQHDGEFEVTTKDGRKLIWDFNSGVIGKLPDGRAVAMSVATDVTERIVREQKISYLSYHDLLTDLHNRRYYEDNLSKLDIPENYPLTIVMSDINGLKLINDAFGHSAGDKLLISAANIISDSSRETDLVARIGGDEIVIAMPNTSGKEAEKIIEKINEKAKKVKVESIELSISFGFDTKNEISEDICEIYRSAEDLMYREKLIEIPSMRSGAIETILNTLNEKDKNSEIHSRTVSEISERIAVSYGMDRQEVNEVKTAGLLHDIGKIIIPIEILLKNGKLTAEEYDLIKGHPEIGFRILNSTHDMRNISNIVLNHHERWDGLGYPRGVKADEIPIQARIIAIADAFDAMTSVRSYREAYTNEQALDEIINNAGTQFDPALAQVFADNFNTIIEVR